MNDTKADQAQGGVRKRCRLCGDETRVSTGIWQSSGGKFHTITRCVDHDGCRERVKAL